MRREGLAKSLTVDLEDKDVKIKRQKRARLMVYILEACGH